MSNMNSKLFQCMLPHYLKWKNSSFGHPYFDAMSVWMFPIIRGPPRRYYKWSIPPNCGNLYIGHNKPFAIHHCWMSVEPCNPEENAWHCMEAGWGLRSRVCSNLGPLTCQNTTRTGLQLWGWSSLYCRFHFWAMVANGGVAGFYHMIL